jgi:hypothetical protein
MYKNNRKEDTRGNSEKNDYLYVPACQSYGTATLPDVVRPKK